MTHAADVARPVRLTTCAQTACRRPRRSPQIRLPRDGYAALGRAGWLGHIDQPVKLARVLACCRFVDDLDTLPILEIDTACRRSTRANLRPRRVSSPARFPATDERVGELFRELLDGVMLCGRGDEVGLAKQPKRIHDLRHCARSTLGSAGRRKRKSRASVSALRQGYWRHARHRQDRYHAQHPGRDRRRRWYSDEGAGCLLALAGIPKVHGVMLAESGGNRGGLVERRLGEVEPPGLEPALPRRGTGHGLDRDRGVRGPPAVLGFRIEQLKK